MDREYIDHFRDVIEEKRNLCGLSQEKMARELGMPLTTYKTMLNGSMVNLPISVVLKAEKLTNLNAYELIGAENEDLKMLKDFRNIPEHTRNAIRSIIEVEWELSSAIPKCDEEHRTTCFAVTGNMEDGMYFDSSSYETIDVANHVHFFHESIDCAIKITSNHFHPVYHMGSILLIHKSAPRDGDTGIFIHKPTSRLYIRRFRQTNPCELISLNGMGSTIFVNSMMKKK